MVNFFIALFGGAYYAGKFLSESNAMAQTDKLCEQRLQLNKEYLSKYVLSEYEQEQLKKEIFSGAKYEYIITEFADDFRFVLGDDWKNELAIPPHISLGNVDVVKYDNYFCSPMAPTFHMDWVYHLMLAERGKIDFYAFWDGYRIGGYMGYEYAVENTDTCLKFAQCVERRLLSTGANIHLEFEVDKPGYKGIWPRDSLTGGCLKIKELCPHRTERVW